MLIHTQPLPLVTARIGLDQGIFYALSTSQNGIELESLARTTSLPKSVLESTLDYLCTQDMATELNPGTYKATPLTHMLLGQLFNDAVTHLSVRPNM
jgi:hypothetical protein